MIVFWTGGYDRDDSYHTAAIGFAVICAFIGYFNDHTAIYVIVRGSSIPNRSHSLIFLKGYWNFVCFLRPCRQ